MTGLLIAVVVGPGIQVATHDVGVLLPANLLAGVFGPGAPVLLGPLPTRTTTLPSAS
ncbi:hypothetical protein [Streptomyces sp. NPDC001530]|uniref:hypothetical protein n=1 Tax=Streptomyces sp. NPDC001530 TaxID=3364582 RepID=UPI003694998A